MYWIHANILGVVGIVLLITDAMVREGFLPPA
jgi:hypothetical protein